MKMRALALSRPGAPIFAAVALLLPSLVHAATLTVQNLADSGPGSLRDAIALNAALGGGNNIVFSSSLTGSITLTSELVISNNLTIAGPGAAVLMVSGNNDTRVFRITSQPVVEISGLNIANGRATSAAGAGIYLNTGGTLVLRDCSVANNSAGFEAGGIRTLGTLVASNCLFLANKSEGNGGGGGAISQQTLGQMTLVNCAFVRNISSYSVGGAMLVWSGNVMIHNCTFAGNYSGDNGGAVAVLSRYVVAITNCTFSANKGLRGGGLFVDPIGGPVLLRNSIVAGNTAPLGGPDVYGAITSQGYNLVGDTSGSSGFGAAGDQLNVAALLGPVQDNGGPTPTMKPLAGSPAIDKGFSGGGTDQRGRARPFDQAAVANAPGGDGSDIGAFEVQPDDLPSAIPPSLVSWWRAEDNFLDSAGTNHGAPDSVFLYDTGKVGQAFRQYFLGGGYVRVPASASLNVGAGSGFSIEAWINVLDTATAYPIVEWNSGPTIGAHLWANVAYAGIGTPGGIYASVDNNLGHRVATAAVLQAGTWHHVVMTYDKFSDLAIYVDGLLRAQTNFGTVTPATGFDLNIGRRPGGAYFYGMLDEISLYRRALSAADVATLYVQGAAGKELPRLRIANAPANSVSLLWQLAYSSYSLESRSNLTTAPWLPVSQSPVQAGAEWQVVAPRLPTSEFFRLSKP